MDPNVEPPVDVEETTILKEKKRPNISAEVREKRAENMRKVSFARIEAAKLRNEEKLDLKEKEVKAKLDKIAEKKTNIRKIKESKGIPVEMPKPVEKEIPKVAQKKVKKQVVVECSSDSDSDTDSSSESEEEVVYVQKKKSSKKASQSIVKAKRQKEPIQQPVQVQKPAFIEPPKITIKFI